MSQPLHPDTVHDRVLAIQRTMTLQHFLVGVLVIAALGYALAFMQTPVVHDATHHFRHITGIACH